MLSRSVFTQDHDDVRSMVRDFVAQEIVPNHEKWEREGKVDPELFRRAGAAGLLGMALPVEYGGAGVDDFRYNAVLIEEIAYQGAFGSGLGLTLHNDLCIPYFNAYANDEQRARWMPGLASGQLIGAIAMTEPSGGSDLAAIRTRAVRDGDEYVINGSKIFISNGINATCLLVVVRTEQDDRYGGLTILVVEEGTPGFERGRSLEKIGLHSQDTAELFFDDARVPVRNRLGEEGQAWLQLMHNLPQERLSLAVSAVAQARAAFLDTCAYARSRKAFGKPIGTREHIKFVLAEIRTEIDIAQTFVDRCLADHSSGELSAVTAAEAKWWCTEMQVRVVDRCLQIHGGYGLMREQSVARAYVDSRAQTIYGGTTEIMKQIIAKDLDLDRAIDR
ncbi:acyl-CoA dehydrogenase [Rhodococcus sp. SRB_17]|uniref:acyl-CoA dehydrogenase family protein n=1 Tax=Rhodococcus sp. OK302 TaxID=1882769 RepID=UPI000B93E7A8|nr:acyl-CoA dehydrogenase family protein [Rhodococcus sp. OK302]NMM84243.1 acyl-CoA dehydrogenase [Rhodococcus sp. SRB_17]OYD69254.1 long-chain-acyl-CoA dehydrogenase [Rhodococcus sp. OK302]